MNAEQFAKIMQHVHRAYEQEILAAVGRNDLQTAREKHKELVGAMALGDLVAKQLREDEQ